MSFIFGNAGAKTQDYCYNDELVLPRRTTVMMVHVVLMSKVTEGIVQSSLSGIGKDNEYLTV